MPPAGNDGSFSRKAPVGYCDESPDVAEAFTTPVGTGFGNPTTRTVAVLFGMPQAEAMTERLPWNGAKALGH
ncbi:hypothetical protein MAE02_06400 [Microvirga aerophila]|uniref:Uncharacterized protein n=1 Tax=Microvirga aerophila TaxID=670291 RepID=A0A512BLV9_9HYPH|nr:hypothetical protein MAE02_06400 [Microvirga aerophila]